MPPTEAAAAKQDEQEESGYEAYREQAQLAMRDNVRRECESVLLGGLGETETALTGKDVDDYMKSWDEDKLKWAKTHDEKMDALQNMAVKFAYDFRSKALLLGKDFLGQIKQAKGKDWNENTRKRWKKHMDKLREGLEFDKAQGKLEAFLHTDLKTMEKEWKKLEEKSDAIRLLSKRLGVTSKEIPALAPLEQEGFADKHYDLRKPLIDKAMKAVKEYDMESSELEGLYREAAELLEGAVSDGLLASAKSKRALATIFESDHSAQDIRAYVRSTLPDYRKTWEQEAIRYDDFEDQTQALPVRLMPRATFIALGFEARQAYLADTHKRFHDAERKADLAGVLEEHIRKCIDREDYDQAKVLLGKAEQDFPESDWADLHTILEDSAFADVSATERDPDAVYDGLMARIESLPKGIQTLYIHALEADKNQDPGLHFATVCAMIDNAILLQEKQRILKDAAPIVEEQTHNGSEQPQTEMMEEYAEEKEEPAETTITKQHQEGDNVIQDEQVAATGIASTALTMKVIHMADDEEAQRAIFEEVKENTNNREFAQKTALKTTIPNHIQLQLQGVNREINKDREYLQSKGRQFTMAHDVAAIAA